MRVSSPMDSLLATSYLGGSSTRQGSMESLLATSYLGGSSTRQPPRLSRPATRLIVIARMIAPSRNDTSAWNSTVLRIS